MHHNELLIVRAEDDKKKNIDILPIFLRGSEEEKVHDISL
jgi:hypothetical protein